MRVFGMNNKDGSPVTEEEFYLKQSIHDLLNTPLGARIMRPNYGTSIMELLDLPLTDYTLIQIQSYLASTLLFQEKNLLLKKLQLQQKSEKLFIIIEGNYLPSGNALTTLDIHLPDFKKT